MNKTVIKLSVSFLILALLFAMTDVSAVWERLRRIEAWVMALSIVAIWVAQAISSLRWQWILAAEGIEMPLRYLFGSYMVGMFTNTFLPTSIGGDIVKTCDVYRFTKNLSLAFSSVFIERFSGLLVLLVFSWFGMNSLARHFSSTLIFVWLLANLAVLVLLFSILRHDTLEAVLSRAEQCFFKKLADFARKCLAIVSSYRQRKLLIARLLMISVPVQLLNILVYQVMAHSIGVSIPFIYLMFGVPLIVIISLLPISLGGLGIREAVSIFIFSIAGIPADLALSLSIMVTAVTYAAGLLGGIILFFRRDSLQGVADTYKSLMARGA